jgi:hypothetical protein
MATQSKIIGRVPVSRQEYVQGATYYKDNIVVRYGSAFQCTVDSTTTPPATLDASGRVTLGEGWIFFANASATHMFKGSLDRLTTLLGYCEKRAVVNLELGVSGKYVQCGSRSAVANAAFAISKPFDVEACSELLIKTGFNPSDASHKGLDLSVIAIYEQIERQRTVQKKNPDGQLLYYVVTTDAETGN